MLKEKILRLITISSIVILIDQITKWMILQNFPLYKSLSIINGFFNITHIQNPGGAFGFFANGSPEIRAILFIIISSIAVLIVLYFYINTPKTHSFLATGFALIFAGAIGNLIDRIRFGKVVDFLDFFIGHLHWPAFNIADSSITIGMAIFIFHIVFNKMPE